MFVDASASTEINTLSLHDALPISFKLAQWAGKQKNAEYIVFCGVHFMAESADILSGEHQKVVLPDLSAGCSMAEDRKSTRLNSSHSQISYAVFCLKKKIDLLIPGA